ncbi:unnamed protein product [Miscanthus lutarioriparius]|uniref:NAC domain-containing protein n=1 Tax=Miscanthus lutarioriparius TaxID=422564 RepID=A0A811NAT9_9POAL|nr:unnamed protein product [Miscanthus lutarioriparius]
MVPADAPPLPPGFRFRPTDEELLTHYLAPKVADAGFAPAALREVDLYEAEPWDLLPAGGGGGEDGGVGYFFCRRSVKFPSGLRTNRATRDGYWKSTGKDRVVVASRSRSSRGDACPLGVRKTLVFYRGRAPTGHKTSWVMHEYRLLHGHGYTSPVHATAGAQVQSEWVICRMFTKKAPGETSQSEQAEAVLHPPLDDHMQPPIDGCGGKTPAPPAAASDSDHQHANCFSNIALAMVQGDTNVNGIESMLQLNRHGREELRVNYSESTYPPVAPSSSAEAALRLRDELAGDSFDLLPQLLDYDEAFPFLRDF